MMMNKIRDLFDKLKRKEKRQDSSHEETLEAQDDAVSEEIIDEENTSDEDHTREIIIPEAPSRKKPEFLTPSFWKNHFDVAVSRIKHARLKNMDIKSDTESNSDQTESKFQTFVKKAQLSLKALMAKNGVSTPTSNKKSIEQLKNLLDPKSRTTINKIFLLSLLCLSTYSVGKVIAIFLANSIPTPRAVQSPIDIDSKRELTQVQVNQMKNAKIFKTDSVTLEPKIDQPVIATNVRCKTASKASRLPIKLINTIVLQDSVKSIASVQIRSEKLPQELREGDQIEGLAQIDKIERLNVIVKNLKDGSCEFVANSLFDNKKPQPIAVMTPQQSKTFVSNKKVDGIENDGNNFKVQKSFLKDKMKDISSILTQARGIQMTNPDGSLAFKIVEVEPGGLFTYLGIQDNDIITQINGQPITDLNQVMNLFGTVTNLDQLNLTIKRNGEEIPQDYKFQ